MNRILLLFLLVSQAMFSINISGKWRINYVPGSREYSVYTLTPIDDETFWGNTITFDGNKFATDDHQECLNSCFKYSFGSFEVVDENHIRLSLEKITYSGLCNGMKSPEPQELGLFYISQEGENIRLVKSDGNAEQDLLNAKYSKLVETDYRNELHGPNHYTCQVKVGYTLEETVKARLEKAGIKQDYKLVYHQRLRYGAKSVAVVENGDRRIYLTVED